MRRAALVLATALAALAAPRLAAAQAVTLEEVETLARTGRVEQARAALLAWWTDARDGATRMDEQRALWLRGRLTVDPAQAMLDYRRLVVLYPGGPFTDQALLRLAQASHALGDAEAARAHVETLIRDYPASPARRTAEAWMASAGPAPAAAATDAGAPARPVSPGDAPPVARASAEVRSPAPAADAAEVFSVQLGAFAETDRAEGVRARASAAGFDARLVRVEGSGLLHVRIGRFSDRAAAEGLLQQVARAGLEGALVRDDRPERPAS